MDDKLKIFTQWMNKENFSISPKVNVFHNPFSNYGLHANDDIEAEEVLFKIPRKSLLSIENSPLHSKLLENNLIEQSKWGSLILCILHELHLQENSTWYSYLSVFPNFDNLKLPLFWNSEDISLLKSTGLESIIENDKLEITKDFIEVIKPFMNKYPDYFSGNIDIEQYKYYVAFVMSYSFTEPNIDAMEDEDDEDNTDLTRDVVPYMVPMADVLNHKAYNNSHLIFDKEHLIMVSTKRIEKSEEIYNTYGDLPNTQLLQMYGFTLTFEENKDDVVELNLCHLTDSDLPDKILVRIKAIKDINPDLLLVLLSKTGFLNTEELSTILYALSLEDKDFELWLEQIDDSWTEENENIDMMADYLDSFETLKMIPLNWKNLISTLVQRELQDKIKSLEDVSKKIVLDRPCPAIFVKKLLSSHAQIMESFLRMVSN